MADWQRNNLNKFVAGGKITNSGSSNSHKGLGAGDKIFMNVEGTPPKLIGKLPNLEKSTIEKTSAYFENQIAKAKIENGFVITTNGEIYHCTEHLNGLPTIEELGKKLNGEVVTHNHPVGSANEHSFSEWDKTLFMDFGLSRLRGIDDKFVYEFNRNPKEVDGGEITIDDLINGYGYRHWDVIRIAKSLKIGYRGGDVNSLNERKLKMTEEITALMDWAHSESDKVISKLKSENKMLGRVYKLF